MTTKNYIKDFYGRIVGSVEDDGRKQIVKDFYGRIVATYSSADNYTRDFYGRIIGRGNIAVSQLYNKK